MSVSSVTCNTGRRRVNKKNIRNFKNMSVKLQLDFRRLNLLTTKRHLRGSLAVTVLAVFVSLWSVTTLLISNSSVK